jgi:hypothetical protein
MALFHNSPWAPSCWPACAGGGCRRTPANQGLNKQEGGAAQIPEIDAVGAASLPKLRRGLLFLLLCLV